MAWWLSVSLIIKTEWESNSHIVCSFFFTPHFRLTKHKKMYRKQTLCLMVFLSSSLFLLLSLVPSLQSFITSSGSSLSTRWRAWSPLSPSPSLEQRRRAETSPSPCEYCTTSHQAYITSHPCSVDFDTCNMQLCSQLHEERQQVRESS